MEPEHQLPPTWPFAILAGSTTFLILFLDEPMTGTNVPPWTGCLIGVVLGVITWLIIAAVEDVRNHHP